MTNGPRGQIVIRRGVQAAVFALIPGACLLARPNTATAAGHEDITVVPLGTAVIQKAEPQQSFRLPTGPGGPLRQAVVLMAARPWHVMQAPAVLDPSSAPQEGEEHREQVPGKFKVEVGGRALPDWELFKFGTAYVVNLETIRGNPEYSKGRLAIKLELDSIADEVEIRAFGMPDPLLVRDSLNGPIALFHQAAATDELKSYFVGLAHELAGSKEQARGVYRSLIAAKDERLARIARRGLRMLSYDQRPHKLSGNFREHYRWGLFLEQASIFTPAYKEFNECRIIYPMHSDAQFRAGEMLDHIEGDVFKVMDFMEQSGVAAWETNPRIWSTLLVVIKGDGERKMTSENMLDLKVAFILSRYMVWAATRGRVAPKASVLELDDESGWPMIEYPGGLIGPSRDIVAERGWFDAVIVTRPRREGDMSITVRTVGGDEGPNGAALTVLQHDATWREFLTAFYQQFMWAAIVGEAGEALPAADEVEDCGYQPIPHTAYGCRSALRYHFSPEMYRRVAMTPRPGNREYARLWQLQGPIPIANPQEKRHHVLDPIPTSTVGRTIHFVSDEDFIDLKRYLGASGPALAQAKCWVYSPVDQEVRMWIGQNDGAAVWINGRLVHSGTYYSSGQYEDRNLTDTIASYAPLASGWNEVRVVVEALAAPADKGWGFSICFATWRDEPVPGLAYLNMPPSQDAAAPYAPPTPEQCYSWNRVRRDWAERLPRLGEADLRKLTGIADLTLSGRSGPAGHVALSAGALSSSPRYRALSDWKEGVDRDIELNNVLDWDREACLAVRYSKDGKKRDLLLVRPEALLPYLYLLEESDSAAIEFAGRAVEDRILGSVIVPSRSSARRLFAIDCLLGKDGSWPLDEEDLLAPIAETYIPNPPRLYPAYTPQPAG